jgi:hypothetical protein
MPTLSQNDPQPDAGRGGPPLRVVAVIAVIVLVLVALHLTGVVGPG